MIEIFYKPTCKSAQKSILFFEKNKIEIKKNKIQNISLEQIQNILNFCKNGFDDILVKRNNKFNFSDMKIKQIFNLLRQNPNLLKSPLIIDSKNLRFQVGYNEDDILIFLRDQTNKKLNYLNSDLTIL